METITAICMGLGLSAACGFRIFIPLLILSFLSQGGWVTLSPGFQWISSSIALIGLGAATVIEISAYYIPWVDNLLDTIASPIAIIAGTLVSASVFVDMDPTLKWSLAIIAGEGSAGLAQSVSVISRGVSTATSGGLANPIVSTIEAILSIIVSISSVFLPFLAIAFVFGISTVTVIRISKYKKSKVLE